MKQLERAQLNAVKGGDGWILLPGGIMNLIPPTTLFTTTGTQNTNNSQTSKKNKKNTKK